MYIDAVDDPPDETHYAVMLGIFGSKLYKSVTQVDDASQPWNGPWEEYQFADVADQTDRIPYALFYLGNSRVYVAYTATVAGTSRDFIAAITTNSVLPDGVQDSSDFFELGPAETGTVRFSGFSVSRTGTNLDKDNEDIDVVVTYCSGKMITFQVDTNEDDCSLSASVSEKQAVFESGSIVMQPDCDYMFGRFYAELPAVAADGSVTVK